MKPAGVSIWTQPVITRFLKTLLLLIAYPAFTSAKPAAETLFTIITPIISSMQISIPGTLPGINQKPRAGILLADRT